MTREEAIRIIKIVLAVVEDFEITVQGEEFTEEKCKEAVEIVTKALAQEPCTDAISRQAVLDLAKFDGRENLGSIIHAFDVEQLPPVTPVEKVGQWKRISMDKWIQHAMAYYRCSECGKDIIGEHNYCPNCGAKMQEVKE